MTAFVVVEEGLSHSEQARDWCAEMSLKAEGFALSQLHLGLVVATTGAPFEDVTPLRPLPTSRLAANPDVAASEMDGVWAAVVHELSRRLDARAWLVVYSDHSGVFAILECVRGAAMRCDFVVGFGEQSVTVDARGETQVSEPGEFSGVVGRLLRARFPDSLPIGGIETFVAAYEDHRLWSVDSDDAIYRRFRRCDGCGAVWTLDRFGFTDDGEERCDSCQSATSDVASQKKPWWRFW